MTQRQSSHKPDSRRLVTIPEAADFLGCHPRTIRRRIASGELPAYRVGSRMIRVSEDDLQVLLQRIPVVGVDF